MQPDRLTVAEIHSGTPSITLFLLLSTQTFDHVKTVLGFKVN